jgi:penicillin amidase
MLDPKTKRALDSFARGVNAFIETHNGSLPLEFTILGYKPSPWTPADSISIAKILGWGLSMNWEAELLRASIVKNLGKEAAMDLMPTYPPDHPLIIGELRISSPAPLLPCSLASNNWVVDGTKSVTGKPLLANDAHLPIQMPSIWYENHLVGAGFDVIGASLPGIPGVVIGHNRHIAWGMTNVGADVQDIYIEKINPENPYQYRYEDRWEDMEVIIEEIEVKGRDEPEICEVLITRHGPIITPVLEGVERPLALRWIGHEPGRVTKGALLLNRARNWEEFLEAMRCWDLPSQNFVYADVMGNIGYFMAGKIPIRAKGNGLAPVPGWTGEYEWVGFIPFEDLPSLYNPETHYIATANNRVIGDDYPYLITLDWAIGDRAARIVELLTAEGKLSLEDFQAMQADAFSAQKKELAKLIVALNPQEEMQKKAIEYVRGWDGECDEESVAATIVQAFYAALIRNIFADELGEDFSTYIERRFFHDLALKRVMEAPDSPWFDDVTTPERETFKEIIEASFSEAVESLREELGDDINGWRWGRLHVATFVHPLGKVKPLDKLFNRGPVGVRGDGSTLCRSAYNPDKPFSVKHVATYRQIVDLADLGRSVSIHSTGQSGQPFHKHFADMLDAWRDVEYHPMLFDRESIEANKEGLLILIPR